MLALVADVCYSNVSLGREINSGGDLASADSLYHDWVSSKRCCRVPSTAETISTCWMGVRLCAARAAKSMAAWRVRHVHLMDRRVLVPSPATEVPVGC